VTAAAALADHGCGSSIFSNCLTEWASKYMCHIIPPGASKWNKIEFHLFCYISKNWRGKPLIDIDTVINLIGDTTTEKGLGAVNKFPLLHIFFMLLSFHDRIKNIN
jgi:hypothetical protein